jgi:hypothetical protein
MPNSLINNVKKMDKNDQSDLTKLAISQYNLVFSIGGS